RAHLLGPGVATRAGRPARRGHASRRRRGACPEGARPIAAGERPDRARRAVAPLRWLVQLVRELATAYSRPPLSQPAAAIAYRVMFSLVPFVALVVSVVDLVLPPSRREQFVDWVFSALPGNDLEHSVDHALDESNSAGPLVGLLSLGLLLWGASGMM